MKHLITSLILFCVGCSSAPKMASVVPPAMPKRAIAKSDASSAGAKIELEPGYTLFVPHITGLPARSTRALTIHFHGEPWFVIDEHLRRGLQDPLLCVALGQGSSV